MPDQPATRQQDFAPLSFTWVCLDEKGNELQRHRGTARMMVEPLAPDCRMEMVAVPAGEFVMGCGASEEGFTPHEQPRRTVRVESFLALRYPVTQVQWRTVAEWEPVERTLEQNPSRFRGTHFPVDRVYYAEAVEFAARLERQTGKPYRLPSEAEWEYACRAGSSGPFHTGPTITSQWANYRGTTPYGDGPASEWRNGPTAAGHFPPNAFGLHDMHGQVWEWCSDHWHDNYLGAPRNSSPRRDGSSRQRVLRGGSWYDIAISCRSGYRVKAGTGAGLISNVGFRLVL